MKQFVNVSLACLVSAALAVTPASAGSLLGGLVKTGNDSGNGNGPVSIGTGSSNTSVGVGGSNGASVNLPLGSGNNSGNVGIDELLTANSGKTSGGGSLTNVDVLGGGGSTLGTNGLGLLGTGGGANVNLPDLDDLLAEVPGDGSPGTPGAPGANGSNGGTAINWYGHGGGGGYTMPGTSNGRLRLILKALQERDWLKLSNGQSICLSSFGAASVSGWLTAGEMQKLRSVIPQYAGDIRTFQSLLAACRGSEQKQALSNGNIRHVIALDLVKGSTPLLFLF